MAGSQKWTAIPCDKGRPLTDGEKKAVERIREKLKMKMLVDIKKPQEVKDLEETILQVITSNHPRLGKICRFCKGRPSLHAYSECPGKLVEDALAEFDRRFSVLKEVPDEPVETDPCLEKCLS